ncbi:MAG: hypothetical protein ACOCVM_04390 [Desulfovibrionaceae bacterium]
MDQQQIRDVFEAYFEKYKKTEGDQSSYSAYWAEHTPAGELEINMTKCPAGTIFKIFKDKKKLTEVNGWAGFFKTMAEIGAKHPDLYDPDTFFASMREMT